ncbi:MAG: hypothetical protein ACREEE_17535 [Dongiaceae bacterium]
MKPRAVIFHDLGHAVAALAAAMELNARLWLWSAADAASYAGIGWFDGIVRQIRTLPGGNDLCMVLDCGDRPELVQAALRQGIKHVCYVGDKRTAAFLADIARQRRAQLHVRRPAHALDLLDAADPAATCRGWLGMAKHAD